jgi:hypothetical protein
MRPLPARPVQEWDRPSLCEGWTVRQVAAHLALQNITWSMIPRALPDMIRHGGMNGPRRVGGDSPR